MIVVATAVALIALLSFVAGLFLFMKGSAQAPQVRGVGGAPPQRRSIAQVAADLTPRREDVDGGPVPLNPAEDPAPAPAPAADSTGGLGDLLKKAFAIVFSSGDDADKYTSPQKLQAQGLLLILVALVFLIIAIPLLVVGFAGGSDTVTGGGVTTSTLITTTSVP